MLGAAAGAASAWTGAGAAGADADLRFEVWRGRQKIGLHTVRFAPSGTALRVQITAQMLVALGPIPLFRYRHQALELWRDGQFVSLESHTVTNGRLETLKAERGADGVSIVAGKATPLRAPPSACPLSHWNLAAMDGPLFNPQTGAQLHEAVSHHPGDSVRLANGQEVEAARCVLTGQADVTDWYDKDGRWVALRAKAPDGSFIDYRRLS
jgi:hypothetical protein